MHFNEEVFIRSLTERREDARRFSQIFRPEWLETVQYRPVLAAIYDFLRQYDTPPSLKVLHEVFESKDKAQYDNRYKTVLTQLQTMDPPDVSEILYTIDKAKDVAVSRSLVEMTESAAFQEMSDEYDGSGQIQAIQRWIQQFEGASEDVEIDIKEGIEMLVKERGFINKATRISCGVDIVDEWSGGGLRTKQLGILLAPTGHGKSMFLTIIAHKMAMVEQKRVLYITNEISWEETVERFLSRITGESLTEIIDDPVVAYKGLERHWKSGLSDRLRLVEVNREINTDDIEGMVGRYINLYGWAPDVVVVDYMERMKPLVSGVKRDQSWNWYGAVAKDLVRCAKRNNWLIWTAGQTNRGGFRKSKEQSLDDAQGSIQHLQEATLVVAMRQVDGFPLQDKEAVVLEFKALKARHHRKTGDRAFVEARLGRVNITKKVHDPEELLDNFGEEEENEDGQVKKSWKSRTRF